MSVKSKLLQEINKKAQKIRDKRVEAANNKTLEVAVFEFFKNLEQAKNLNGGSFYDRTLFDQARQSLISRLKAFDPKMKFTIEYAPLPDESSWEEGDVCGVTIWWSQAYIAKNNVDPSLYIDISQMLFL